MADLLRQRITDGGLPPGARLSEELISESLGVSRNTLREAFRLLIRERLLVHELHRGVSVRVLGLADVVDIYRVRRFVECAAVGESQTAPAACLASVGDALAEAETAAAAGDWRAFATADLHFHQAIGRLAGSPRLDELMRRILAELRLVFAVMRDPREFHEPYLARNRHIWLLLRDGDVAGAEAVLRQYLDAAEAQLVAAYKLASGLPVPSPGRAKPVSLTFHADRRTDPASSPDHDDIPGVPQAWREAGAESEETRP